MKLLFTTLFALLYSLAANGQPVKPPSRATVPTPVRAPTKAPIQPRTRAPRTRAPIKPRTKAPVRPPTKAPVKAPVKAPIKAPVKPTLRPSTKAPVKPPTKPPTRAPTKPPTNAPTTAAPTSAPTNKPTLRPTVAPTSVPTSNPTVAPTLAPTNEPTIEPTTLLPTIEPTLSPTAGPTATPTRSPIETASFLEYMLVPQVTADAWSTVKLERAYVSPIAVCTVMYKQSLKVLRQIPMVVRMNNLGPNSFDIRLQNPSNTKDHYGGRDVSCLVVEEGRWTMPDGRKIDAKKYESTVTDGKDSWVGQAHYSRGFIKNGRAVVLGQVMSFRDAQWSTFWSRDYTRPGFIDQEVITGKHVGKDANKNRAAETVGFLLIESAYDGAASPSVAMATGRSTEGKAYGNQGFICMFNRFFTSHPKVVVLTQSGMNENDGSWAVLAYNNPAAMMLSYDEDQTTNADRTHGYEFLHYAAFFATRGSYKLTKAIA